MILYFRLRFGLVNSSNSHLRLKICVVWRVGRGIFYYLLKSVLYEFAIPNLSLIYISVSDILKPSFGINFMCACCELTKVIL